MPEMNITEDANGGDIFSSAIKWPPNSDQSIEKVQFVKLLSHGLIICVVYGHLG